MEIIILILLCVVIVCLIVLLMQNKSKEVETSSADSLILQKNFEYLLKYLDWNNNKLSNNIELFNFSTQQLSLLNSLGGAYKIEK